MTGLSGKAASIGLAPALTIRARRILFESSFPRGRGKFWEVEFGTESEQPDSEYPFNMSTGRVLYHWHGRTMTGRSRLDNIYPEATCEMDPEDAERLGTGDWRLGGSQLAAGRD